MKQHFTHLLFILPVLLGSCKKNDEIDQKNALTLQDYHIATATLEVEYFINELEFVARTIKTAYPNQPGILQGSTITQGVTNEGKTKYDILFNNLTGTDNKKRNGKLTVVFEDALENGSTVTGKHLHVRSDDENNLYSVEGIKFKGSLIFSNIATAKGSTTVPISHLNAQSFILKPNSDEIRFSSLRKSYWISGSNTADINDDIFDINEQDYSIDLIQSGTTSFADVSTSTKLTLSYACSASPFFARKGNMLIEHFTGKSMYLLMGNGNCSDMPNILLKPE